MINLTTSDNYKLTISQVVKYKNILLKIQVIIVKIYGVTHVN